MSSTQEGIARFEAELRRDWQLRDLFNYGSLAVSICTAATLLTLTIGFDRSSPFLVALSLYTIGTRLSYYVAWKALLVPAFLLELASPDAGRAAAAAAVLERHRDRIVRPILRDHLLACDAAAVAAAPVAQIAKLAVDYGVESRRRFGRRWLAAWCFVTLLLWTTLFWTGGGPTG